MCEIGNTRSTLDPTNPGDTKSVYDQLCLSYRAIDEFRSKLLGFLPLATGTGGVVLFTNNSLFTAQSSFLGPAGVFGFVVTFGLFTYELYGIRKCHALIVAGKQLEGVLSGQFKERPQALARLVNEPFAAAIIYPAVMAAWAYLRRTDSRRLGARCHLHRMRPQVLLQSSSLPWAFC